MTSRRRIIDPATDMGYQPKLKRWRDRPGVDSGFLGQAIRRLRKEYQWVWVIGLWVFGLTLGFSGLSKYAISRGDSYSPLDLIYMTLQLVGLDSGSVRAPLPWELEIARFALPTMAAYTAVQALAVLFRERFQLVRLRFIHDHVVICGLSRKGLLLARNLLEHGEVVVVIELDNGNDSIEQLRVRGAIVLIGDATDHAVLRRAAVHRAKYLLAVCDDDGTNAEIAVQASKIADTRDRHRLTCIIHIVDPRLCDLLREHEIGGQTFTRLRLELFNVFDRGAQLLLREFSPFNFGRQPSASAPHILLLGMGRMGDSLVSQAAFAWHSRNPDSSNPLGITVIDLQASQKWEAMKARSPHLAESCHVHAISMDVCSPELYEARFLAQSPGRPVDMAYICFDNDSLGLYAGLLLLRLTSERNIPIVVRMREEHGLASLLDDAIEEKSAFRNLHAFGLLDRTCTPELLFGGIHEMLARAVHEDYLREQDPLGHASEAEPYLVPWDQLAEDIKESNRRYADHIGLKLGAVEHRIEPLRDWDAVDYRFNENDIEIMARMEHEHWRQERKREDWSYGPERNNSRKAHPSLVPWEALPEAEKAKNRNFIRDLPHLLARAGFQVYRLS